MLYDLNIAWSPSTTSAQLQRTLRFASSLGYDAVALNYVVSPPIPSQVTNLVPAIPPQSPSPGSSSSPPYRLPNTFRRCTIIVSDPAINHKLSAFAAAYDIVAVRPTTERAYAACCTTMTEFSLISFDLTASFPFYFNPRTSMAAVNRGIRFEICYAQVLAAGQDPRARANFIANLSSLLRATRGRGIVLSSEARSPLEIRAPADVVNLLAVWGLGAERGGEGLGVNPRAVVLNEGIKRRGFRGVVDIVHAPTDGNPATTDGNNRRGPEGDDTGDQKRKGRRGARIVERDSLVEQTGQKRRSEEVDDRTGKTAALAGKRQTKKLRVSAQREQAHAKD